jgi:hypothetical protein
MWHMQVDCQAYKQVSFFWTSQTTGQTSGQAKKKRRQLAIKSL